MKKKIDEKYPEGHKQFDGLTGDEESIKEYILENEGEEK